MVNEPDEPSSESRPVGGSPNSPSKKPSRNPEIERDEVSPKDETISQGSGIRDGANESDASDSTVKRPDDVPASQPPETVPQGENRPHSQSSSASPHADNADEEVASDGTTTTKAIAEPGPDPEYDQHHHIDPDDYEESQSSQQRHAEYHPRAEDEEWDGEEDEGGGPVKSFLEHLEDLRWVIIRCAISIVIGMVVCLAAANKVVDLLKEPLARAQKIAGKTEDYVVLFQPGPTSTNLVTIKLQTNQFGAVSLGTNRAIKLLMEPVMVGTNFILGLKPVPAREEEIPYENLVSLKNMGPISPFVVAMKIALFGGIGLASPFVFFFIGQFVVPALRRKEKRYLYQALAIGTGLFCAGVAFCYFAMLQIALNAAMKFSKWMNFEPDIWRAEEYISFVVKFLLGMGLSFELPVVLLTLVKLELLDYERMKKFRPYWVVVNLVLAAMLTPPDVVSQLLMAIPLQVLYEISVLIAWYWHRRDEKRLREEG